MASITSAASGLRSHSSVVAGTMASTVAQSPVWMLLRTREALMGLSAHYFRGRIRHSMPFSGRDWVMIRLYRAVT